MNQRKIDGKMFTQVDTILSQTSRKEAEAAAQNWRNKGYQARILNWQYGYSRIFIYPPPCVIIQNGVETLVSKRELEQSLSRGRTKKIN